MTEKMIAPQRQLSSWEEVSLCVVQYAAVPEVVAIMVANFQVEKLLID